MSYHRVSPKVLIARREKALRDAGLLDSKSRYNYLKIKGASLT